MLSTGGLQRAAEDARGAAAAGEVHLRHDRVPQDPRHHPLALPAVRLPDDPGARAGGCTCARWPTARGSRSPTRRSASIARAAEGSVRDALSLFDQVLAFSGDEVKDEDVAALLGLVDRELLHRASRAIVEGDSLRHARAGREPLRLRRRLPQLRARAAAALPRDPAREARARGSSLLARVAARGARAAARAGARRSREEDLLRVLDLLTKAETELRDAQDPRVALELALLKLVQMRRLHAVRGAGGARRADAGRRGAPGATGGAPAAPRRHCPRAGRRPQRPSPRLRADSGRARPQHRPLPAAPEPRRRRRPQPAPADDAAAGDARAVPGAALARRAAARGGRASRGRHAGARGAARLRCASRRCTPTSTASWRARPPAGRALKVRVGARRAAPEAPRRGLAGRGARRERLREEAEREPAVQEALDLFDGRVVDVREAKPAREDA